MNKRVEKKKRLKQNKIQINKRIDKVIIFLNSQQTKKKTKKILKKVLKSSEIKTKTTKKSH